MVLQRRVASSIYAITRSLENRRTALDKVLEILRDPARSEAEKKSLLRGEAGDVPDDIAEYEEMDEGQRDDVGRRIFGQVLSADPAAVEREREEVAELVRMALSLRHHNEAKFAELMRVLDSSDVIRREDEKLVIFTEHRDTMDSLTQRLRQKGYAVVNIHGGMDVEARRDAQREFRLKAKLLVATDAAGEGINLQFCRYLINWDIPWNPNRLEQRMGRIHRYGQHSDVWVYNLVATNTREGAVLERVLTKLDVMRDQMGSDRVYDVIEELLEDVPLLELIEQSIDADDDAGGSRVVAEAEGRLTEDDLDRRAEELIDRQKHQSYTSRLDMETARELRDASDVRRLQPQFIDRFFRKAYAAVGGSVVQDEYFPVYHVGTTPTSLRELADNRRLPVREKYDTPFVFDKSLVSVASAVRVPEGTKLLGPGHVLFEALIAWTDRQARDAFTKGAVVVDPNIARPQRIWLLRSTISDDRREERKRQAHEALHVVAVDHLGLRATSPASLLSYTPPTDPMAVPESPGQALEEVQLWAYENLTEKALETVRETRQEESDLRRGYLESTFTQLILDLSEELEGYQRLQLFGDDDPEERRQIEQRIEQLRQRKAQRLQELDQMMHLTANLPDILTSAIVAPAPVATLEPDEEDFRRGVPMRRDDEVEAIAMAVAMRYERSRGWTPHDVSQDGEHYDVRSDSVDGEKRFIEVKGRASSGAIVLTAPEVDRLTQLADRAYLYVVTFCRSEIPRLRIIGNPMQHLNPDAAYRQVQYWVTEADWRSKGEEVDGVPTAD